MATLVAGGSPLEGLDDGQVRARVARGEVNAVTETPERSVRDIVRTNTLTRFNAILGVLFVITVIIGPPQDALFGVILVLNTVIGVVQELRAKRTLDRLAVLSTPQARVVRGGRVQPVAVEAVVLDDVLEVAAGDQLVVDGVVLTAHGLEVDESLLSGESDPVVKRVGDEVLSGSFAVAGAGRYRASRVGDRAYGHELALQARRFAMTQSELRAGINRVLGLLVWAMVPIGILLAVSQARAQPHAVDALRSAVAGMVAMVPEGLVLLTSVAFAVAVVRLGRRSVLAQELPAVEMLARCDVVCVDKTGTLTDGDIVLEEVQGLEVGAAPLDVLGAIAAADGSPNASMRAIAAGCPAPAGWHATEAVAFSSARRWSAVAFTAQGTWLLGAPDVLLPSVRDGEVLRDRADTLAASGQRVLLLARAPDGLTGERIPGGLVAVAFALLRERLREDVAATVRYFTDQGVTVKVISGDNPRTVAAVAALAGVPDAQQAVDARTLPEDADLLGEVLHDNAVFGRVTPQQKRAMVGALQRRGHVVAMTGDGVNDVLALKDSDIGVAMGSGSAASRAVAQLVLLDGSFANLPYAVGEGRRVIANVERVANLFLIKTVYAMLLALAVGVATLPFPFLSRQLSLIAGVTVGAPAFFMALEPNARRARPGFLLRTLRFSVPAGVVAAVASFTAYSLALNQGHVSVGEARATATIVMIGIGLWLLTVLARPLNVWRRVLVGSMGAAFLLAAAVPATRSFFALQVPPAIVWLAGVGVVALTVFTIEIGWRFMGWIIQATRPLWETQPVVLDDVTEETPATAAGDGPVG